ncbi:hypothetical protein [Flavobacterium humi]|uniref:Uncharacterized protein n=1 Tax=Flavobacterium humi TaxID=2562683 RepID=A0A4Z0LBB7_9FLAO|nr:hypothetical protein [Flavobacterium humi]TGD59148.1 hypothetical protein E4635_04670 [Flavobacterium humi]
MKTEKELNSDILELTMSIKKNYPELTKYLKEMQVTLPDNTKPEITVKILQEYYDSLNEMLDKYAENNHLSLH